MKIRCFLGLAALLCASIAYGDTISEWTFETSPPVTGSTASYGADGGVNAASANMLGYHSAANSTTFSDATGNGSANALNSKNWSVGDYYQFSVPTTGYQNILISFDQTSSGSGPKDFEVQYSTDGSLFTTIGFYQVSDNSGGWTASSRDLGDNFSYGVGLLTSGNADNQPMLYIRLAEEDSTSANNGTVSGGGTDRADNFSISGDAITVPLPAASAGGLALMGLLAMKARRGLIVIN